ncbi:hypothetical protein HA402_001723 [Bradysia odoriphaga]|nr:hypothetical protein HA402_001723 [Bradysia odoriphaga]
MEPEQPEKIVIAPKVSVEEASGMSLEEYISAAGIKAPLVKRDRNRRRNQNFESVASMDIDESMPDASSLQWRLKDPNRPVGMAPLIPAAARQKERLGNSQYRNRRYFDKPYADRDKPNGLNRNNQSKFKNNGMRSNANCQAGLRNAAHGICNALVPYHQNNSMATINQISENVVGLVAPLIANSNFENVFNKLLEKWEQKKIQSTPKYNMSVQKEISEMQGKTLTFTCSSGLTTPVVVTQDGQGVDDCQVNPVTTDTSMNQRFA